MKIVNYNLFGRIPAKKDSQRICRKFGKGKPFIASSIAHSKWEKFALYHLKVQKNHETIDVCQSIQITLLYGDLKQKDNTNTADSIMDALVKAEIIKDDNWKVTGTITLIPKYEKDKHGAEIIIYWQ